MINELRQVSVSIFQQLNYLIVQLSDDEYSLPLDLLSSNTVAKHIRHVLELYDEMINGLESGVVNYDARKRNLLIEHNREYAIGFMQDLEQRLQAIKEDAPIQVVASYTEKCSSLLINTTISREFTYNIEHAIHHMAIIQICVKQYWNHIHLDKNFGVAFSTQAYLKKHVHTNIPAK